MAHQPRHQGSGNLESRGQCKRLTLLQPGQSGTLMNGLMSSCCG